jgi:hypothetical protein
VQHHIGQHSGNHQKHQECYHAAAKAALWRWPAGPLPMQHILLVVPLRILHRLLVRALRIPHRLLMRALGRLLPRIRKSHTIKPFLLSTLEGKA